MRESTELLQSFYNYFIETIPSFLMGIGFLIGSYIVYKIVLWLVMKLLKLSKIEKLNGKINEIEIFENSNFKIDITKVILSFVKFILILILLIVGSELLELKIVSEQISDLLAYLPKLISGVLIFAIGTYLASQAKKAIHKMLKSLDSGGSKAISSLVFYLIFIFVTITAINQIGIDTTIISNNLSYLIGAALVTVVVAVGLGSRDVVYRLILGFYAKKNLEPGMKIKIGDDLEGVIESFDNISITLKSGDEKIIVPIKKISNSQIKIIS